MEIDSDIICPIQLLTQMFALAAIGYKDHRRKDPERSPYINHGIEAAENLRRANILCPTMIAAAIGHDLLEIDPCIRTHPMYLNLPRRVRSLIESVTDPETLTSTSERKAWQLQVMGNTECLDWVHLKLADRLSNCRSMSPIHPTGWSHEKKVAYLGHSKQLARIANERAANNYLVKELKLVCREQLLRIEGNSHPATS